MLYLHEIFHLIRTNIVLCANVFERSVALSALFFTKAPHRHQKKFSERNCDDDLQMAWRLPETKWQDCSNVQN
jgi:hypothetical protein